MERKIYLKYWFLRKTGTIIYYCPKFFLSRIFFENGTGIKINNSNRNKLTNIKELIPYNYRLIPYNYRLRPTPLAGSTRKFTLSA